MTVAAMASAISTPSYLCSSLSSFTSRKPTLYTLSTYVISNPQSPDFRFSTWVSQLGLRPFSPWNGLRHLGITISKQPVKIERKGKRKGKVIYASLFGVGAPEALVIGVVALLVFGPKGLAEVARNLGKTLRAFQPTIRELQDVSREFKSTLEREIGLDEVQNSTQNRYEPKAANTTSSPSSIGSPEKSQIEVDPNGSASPTRAYSSEEYLKITEEQLKASTAQQQRESTSLGGSQSESQTKSQDTVQKAAVVTPPPQKPESEA